MSAARIRGWHVLAMMLAFFGVVIAVNAAFIVYAVGTFPGEDVPRSYVQGLNYNETLAERRVQQALGWQATAAARGSAADALIEVRLRAHDGVPLDGLSLSGELQRPATDARDQPLTFEPQGDGRYVARVGTLQSGRWRLLAHASSGSGALDFESELTWRSR